MFRILLSFAALGGACAWADVVTTLSGSKLVVSGDDSPDTVQIEPAADGITVTGLDGTLVDGSSQGVTISGVQRLIVKLARGGDHLTIRDVTLSNKLDIRLGRGGDSVLLDGVRAGATHISTANSDDLVTIVGPSSFKSLSVQTSNGNDSVLLDGAWVPDDLTIDTGAGDDDVTIVATEVGDDVDVHLGNDEDILWIADVAFDDDTHLDGEHGDNALVLDGYIWFGDHLDIDGFGDDWSWWWY